MSPPVKRFVVIGVVVVAGVSVPVILAGGPTNVGRTAGWNLGAPRLPDAAVPGWRVVDAGSVPGATLADVVAVDSRDAWAVGSAGGRPLVRRWDGTSWRTDAVPDQPAGVTTASLRFVRAVSAGDVWAFGSRTPASGVPEVFVLHWTGAAWEQAPLGSGITLSAAAVTAPAKARPAAKPRRTPAKSPAGTPAKTPGKSRKATPSATPSAPSDVAATPGVTPTPGLNDLEGNPAPSVTPTPAVTPTGTPPAPAPAATPPGQVWVFGTVQGKGGPHAWSAHFDGREWQRGDVPGRVTAVSARTAQDVVAVGTTGAGQPMALRWNGARWTSLPVPARLRTGQAYDFTAVYAAGPGEVWATVQPKGRKAAFVLLRWNGAAWQRVQAKTAAQTVTGLAPDGGNGLWISTRRKAGGSLLLHYLPGKAKTTRRAAPAEPGGTGSIAALSAVPGTGSLWAVGLLDGDGGQRAAVDKYGF